MKQYEQYIDHTILAADATHDKLVKLCEEAKQYGFKSVCINPSYILDAKKLLAGSNVLICTVIGFPLGQMTTEAKVFETTDAIKKGAQEIDMVMNIARFKDQQYDYVLDEINAVKKACGNITLKVIVETALLTKEEIEAVARLILKSDADFIKTSTGFSTSGAKLEDIITWKKILGNNKKIKAAGGVRTHEDLVKFIESGADRIGTSSGVKLINKESSDKNSY